MEHVTDSAGKRLEEILEQYIAEVQTLLGREYQYATASGIVPEGGQDEVQHADIVIYVSRKEKHVLVENALEAMTLKFCRKYKISLAVSLRSIDDISF